LSEPCRRRKHGRSGGRAAEKIREQAALLDKAHDAICVTNMEQQILYWNKGAERLYGWANQEAVGQNVIDLPFLRVDQPARWKR